MRARRPKRAAAKVETAPERRASLAVHVDANFLSAVAVRVLDGALAIVEEQALEECMSAALHGRMSAVFCTDGVEGVCAGSLAEALAARLVRRGFAVRCVIVETSALGMSRGRPGVEIKWGGLA